MIDGVLITPQKRIGHPKGDIFHAMKKSEEGFLGFGEAYFSTVYSGDIKGWKRHNQMTLNLVVPLGAIRFTIYDDRDGSGSQGQFLRILLGENNYSRLTISPGLWVSFEGIGNTTNLLLNILNEEHDPDESDDAPLDAFTPGT